MAPESGTLISVRLRSLVFSLPLRGKEKFLRDPSPWPRMSVARGRTVSEGEPRWGFRDGVTPEPHLFLADASMRSQPQWRGGNPGAWATSSLPVSENPWIPPPPPARDGRHPLFGGVHASVGIP
jgi:hypothetical protein